MLDHNDYAAAAAANAIGAMFTIVFVLFAALVLTSGYAVKLYFDANYTCIKVDNE